MIDPDWTNPSSIKTYFDNFTIDTTSYYKSASDYYTWKADRHWKSLGNKVSNEQWSDEGYASYVNAFFDPQLNQVSIHILYNSTYYSSLIFI
jgi:predicted metalloendopeptidase